MTFGEKLQSLRRGAGMSQDALAERLEVSRQAVSKWERDEAMPETEKVIRIAKLFGVSLDELLMDGAPQTPREPPQSQPQYRPVPSSMDRLEAFLRRHGYKFGYALMAVGGLICAVSILMRLLWPAMAGGFLEGFHSMSGFGDTQWVEVQMPDDLPDSVKQEILEQIEAEAGPGGYSIFGDFTNQAAQSMNRVATAQANLFLVGLLPGGALIAAGALVVVKGKKMAAKG